MAATAMKFEPATKKKSKLRMALVGPSGSGKTYTALAVAAGLAPGGRVALIDTERGSASKYADKFHFDVMELVQFEPQMYGEAIHAAEKAGYDVIIIDSLSHAWEGKGGLLEQVDKIAERNRNPNTFAAWKDATPIQNDMVDAILRANAHVIVTMRVHTEWVMEENDKGRKVPRKVGLQPVQRKGIEYEFDLVGDIHESRLVVTKTRCSALSKAVIDEPGAELGNTLKTWLTDGSEAPAPTRPEPVMKEEQDPPASAPVVQPPPAAAPAATRPLGLGPDHQLRARRVYNAKRMPTLKFQEWVATVIGKPKKSPDWTPTELAELERASGVVKGPIAVPNEPEDIPF